MGKIIQFNKKSQMRDPLSMTNDIIFFLVYGAGTKKSNKALLSLLNVVLERKDPITEVKIVNTVHKGVHPGDKETVMDVKARSEKGEQFNIEMQASVQLFFGERTLVYGARMVNSSLAKGEDYDTMKKSIVISFIDGVMFKDTPSFHTKFELRENREGLLLTDRLEIYFLELGKIDDSKDPEEMEPLERLCAYLKFAGDYRRADYVEKLLDTGEEAVLMSDQVFREITEDESLQDLLWRREIAEHDLATKVMLAEKDGERIGIEKGIEKGIAAFIQDYVEDGREAEAIIEKLVLRFDLQEDEARQYYEKYSDC